MLGLRSVSVRLANQAKGAVFHFTCRNQNVPVTRLIPDADMLFLIGP